MNLDQALHVVAKELLNNKEDWGAWAAKADILYSMGLYESARAKWYKREGRGSNVLLGATLRHERLGGSP